MKKIAGLLFLVAVLLTGCLLYVPQGGYDSSGTPPPEARPDDQWRYDQQDVSDFYAYLGPQGLWVSYSPYGYVWMPRGIDYHWRPYTRGHWVFTDDGWTWMSGESWGWLVYHYGRWGWDRRLGWFWVPGTVWGPSWVAWRWGDAYIGWAPIPPGDDFDPRFGYRRHDFAIPGHYWNFIRGHEFMDRDLDRWVIPPERNVTIINYTRLNINIHVKENHVINDGVGVDHVRGLTNQIVERRQLKDARRPDEAKVEARDVVVYRPEIRRSESARPKEVLEKDQAAARIDQEPQARGRLVPRASQAEEASIRRLQDDEKRRLEQDQRTEVDAIRRKADSEKTSVRNPADKQKIDASAKARIAEAQKRQESEKAQMAARHKEESEKVKKVQVKKKETEEKH